MLSNPESAAYNFSELLNSDNTTCIQVRKQQLHLDVEQQTGSK